MRGHLIPGRLLQQRTKDLWASKFVAGTFTDIPFLDVGLDEIPCQMLLAQSGHYFLTLTAEQTLHRAETITYSGTGLILIDVLAFKYITKQTLRQEILHLAGCYDIRLLQTNAHSDQKFELMSLLVNIQGLNECLYKTARKDRKLSDRVGNSFRRGGVVHFKGISEHGWIAIRSTDEKTSGSTRRILYLSRMAKHRLSHTNCAVQFILTCEVKTLCCKKSSTHKMTTKFVLSRTCGSASWFDLFFAIHNRGMPVQNSALFTIQSDDVWSLTYQLVAPS